jgi:S1-C subfamily serine protease
MISRLDPFIRCHAILCVIVLAWASTGGTASAGPVGPGLSQAVVTVVAYGDQGEVLRTGAGLLLTAEGCIATNHHLVEGASRVAVEVPGGRSPRHASILYSDPRRDLTILSGAVPSTGAKPTLEGSDWIDVGEPVLVIIEGDQIPGPSQLAGRVAGSREDDAAVRYIYIQSDDLPSADVGGRPIVNEAGSLIGLTIGVLAGSRDLVSAMPVSDVRLALARARASAASIPPADRSAGVRAGTELPTRAEAGLERSAPRDGVAATRTGAPLSPVDTRLGPGPDLPLFPSDTVGSVSPVALSTRAPASLADPVGRWIHPLPPLSPGPMPAQQIETANRVRAKMTEIARQSHNRAVFQLDPMTQVQVYFQALRQLGILE